MISQWLSVCLLVLFSFTPKSFSQEIISVKSNDVTVELKPGHTFSQGEAVSVLTSELNESGKGIIKKISPNQTRALVQLQSGTAQKGMTIEKSVLAESVQAQASTVRPSSGLSEEEARILAIGEISTERYIIGGVVGTYPLGLGIGHAIQGRYSDSGYIFTIGELGSLAVLVAGVADCDDDWWDSDEDNDDCDGGLVLLGAAGFVGFRIWEIIDLWATPPGHNRRVREIKIRQGIARGEWDGFIIPSRDGGAMAGLKYTF